MLFDFFDNGSLFKMSNDVVILTGTAANIQPVGQHRLGGWINQVRGDPYGGVGWQRDAHPFGRLAFAHLVQSDFLDHCHRLALV